MAHNGQGWQIYCSTCSGLCFYSESGLWKHYSFDGPSNHEPTRGPDFEMIPPSFGCCPVNLPFHNIGRRWSAQPERHQ